MKKTIIQILVIFICLISCNNSKKEKPMKSSAIEMDKYTILNEKMGDCFKRPTDEEFRKRIKEVSGIDLITFEKVVKDITESPDKEIILTPNEVYPEVAVKGYNYLIPIDLDPEIPYLEDLKKMGKELFDQTNKRVTGILCNYNNMIFYKDSTATNWIKTNRPSCIIDIVKKYGYTDRDDWLKYTFSNADLSSPEELNKFVFGYRYDSIFSMEADIDAYGQWQLRKDMLDKMIEHRAELSQLSTIANWVYKYPESYEGDAKEIYGYLMAKCYKVGQAGMIEYIYDNDSELKDIFEKYNYYGDKDLKEFTYETYIPKNKRFGQSSLGPEMYIAYAVIDDPDGYSNLRADKNSKSKIKKKILKGEKFAIQAQSEGKWWTVITEEGTTGHIHSSRVKIIEVVDTEKLNALLESSK